MLTRSCRKIVSCIIEPESCISSLPTLSWSHLELFKVPRMGLC